MSVLSWFKFTIWNHWYKPNRINFKYESGSGAKGGTAVGATPPDPKPTVWAASSILIPFKPNYFNYPGRIDAFTQLAGKPPSEVSTPLGTRPKQPGTPKLSLGTVPRFRSPENNSLNRPLAAILFKTNMFLSLYGVSRAIYLGYVFINFKPSRYNLNAGILNYNLITIYSSFKYSKLITTSNKPNANYFSFEPLFRPVGAQAHSVANSGAIISGFLFWFNFKLPAPWGGQVNFADRIKPVQPWGNPQRGFPRSGPVAGRGETSEGGFGPRSGPGGLPTAGFVALKGSAFYPKPTVVASTGSASQSIISNTANRVKGWQPGRLASRNILTNTLFISINPNIKSFFILPTSVRQTFK